MRSLQAISDHARKTARSLPVENPVIAIDLNAEKRRNTALGLRGWKIFERWRTGSGASSISFC
jgi:hypothetical protein